METLPTKDEFAKLLTDRIRQAGEKGNIVYEARGVPPAGEGKRAAVMFLANAYKEYSAADEDCASGWSSGGCGTGLASFEEMPEDFEDVKPDLMPVVRSRSHFESNSLAGRSKAAGPLLALPSPGRAFRQSAWSTTCPTRCGRSPRRTSMPGA